MNNLEIFDILEKVKNIIVIPPDIKKILNEVNLNRDGSVNLNNSYK